MSHDRRREILPVCETTDIPERCKNAVESSDPGQPDARTSPIQDRNVAAIGLNSVALLVQSAGEPAMPDRSTNGRTEGGHPGVYGAYRDGPLYFSGSVPYGRFDNSTTRSINAAGLPSEFVTGRFASASFPGVLNLDGGGRLAASQLRLSQRYNSRIHGSAVTPRHRSTGAGQSARTDLSGAVDDVLAVLSRPAVRQQVHA